MSIDNDDTPGMPAAFVADDGRPFDPQPEEREAWPDNEKRCPAPAFGNKPVPHGTPARRRSTANRTQRDVYRGILGTNEGLVLPKHLRGDVGVRGGAEPSCPAYERTMSKALAFDGRPANGGLPVPPTKNR